MTGPNQEVVRFPFTRKYFDLVEIEHILSKLKFTVIENTIFKYSYQYCRWLLIKLRITTPSEFKITAVQHLLSG